MTRIGLLNYGAGNFASVRNALVHLGLDPLEIVQPETLDQASHLILPGVGSFPATMEKLHQLGLVQALRHHVLALRKPFLGICVGMQILAQRGFEFQPTDGLGYLDGQVRSIDVGGSGLSIPHIGWNELTIAREHPLLANMPATPSFYFVHSFAFQPVQSDVTLAHCHYGGPVAAVVQRDNIHGVQFHPEKSQRDGLQLFKNFSQL